MDVLKVDDIILDARVDSRDEAVRSVGDILVDHGYATVGYLGRMVEHDERNGSFIGNGVVAVYGVGEEAWQHVDENGISLLQVPQGISWDGGLEVYLVFGVAAGNEQQQERLLSTIGIACADPMNVEKIRRAPTTREILEIFKDIE